MTKKTKAVTNRKLLNEIKSGFKALKTQRTKKANIHLKIVLDRSGSMESCRSEVMGGFNEYIEKLKKDKKSNYTVTLNQFDDQFETVYKDLPIKDVPKLTTETFVPRGWTALNDAIGKTIVESGAIKDASVLLVVFTDGAENASKEFTVEKVKELIKAREAQGNWTVTYIGQDLNSQRHSLSYGISLNNYLQAGVGAKGMSAAIGTLTGATVQYSNTVSRSYGDSGQCVNSANFFVGTDAGSTEDKKKASK